MPRKLVLAVFAVAVGCGQSAGPSSTAIVAPEGDGEAGTDGDVAPEAGIDVFDIDAYWAAEQASDASRPSTGAGAMLPDGGCSTSGWIPSSDSGSCVLPCGDLTVPIDAGTVPDVVTLTDQIGDGGLIEGGLGDGGVRDGSPGDGGPADGGMEAETGSSAPLTAPEFTITDSQLCIASPCKPPFAFQQDFVGILDIPFHCSGSAPTCDCLPPNICGVNGACASVDGNTITCSCQPDP